MLPKKNYGPKENGITIIMNDTKELVENFTHVVSLPTVYLKVREVIEDETSAVDDIVDIISADPGISGRMLRIVNSAFYGLPSKVNSLKHATSILGRTHIHDLVLATSLASAFPKIPDSIMSMEEYWRNSLYIALSAKTLGKKCNYIDADQLFLQGLLSGLGHLVLYYEFPEVCENAIRHAQSQDIPVHTIETEMLNFSFADISAALLREWSFPASVWFPIQNHLHPQVEDSAAFPAAILNIAWAMCQTSMNDRLYSLADSNSWTITGLYPDALHEVRLIVDGEINQVLETIYSSSVNAA